MTSCADRGGQHEQCHRAGSAIVQRADQPCSYAADEELKKAQEGRCVAGYASRGPMANAVVLGKMKPAVDI